jgi:hypothetical protein
MKTRLMKLAMFVLFACALPLQLTCFSREVDRTGAGWCQAGYSDICYDGPEDSRGLGVCKSGQYYCWEETTVDEKSGLEKSRLFRACRNQVVPSQEVCNGLDDDCDGVVDNNGACSGEDLTALQDRIGPTIGIYENDRIGPLFLAKQVRGPLYSCGAMTSIDCVNTFLAEFGGIYGIVDPANQVDLVDTELGIVKGHQKHKGVPVPDGSISFYLNNDPNDNAILSIVNSFYPLLASLGVEPAIASSDLVLDEEAGPVIGTPDLVVLVPLGEDAKRKPIEEQEPQLAWKVVTEETVVYYSAESGDQVAVEPNVHRALDRHIKRNGKTQADEDNPPLPGNVVEAIWTVLGDYYDFMKDADALDLVNGDAATFNVDIVNSGCCGLKTCSSRFIDTKDEIQICEATLKTGGEVLAKSAIHEASHRVFLATTGLAGKGDDGLAIDEFFPIFSVLLYDCAENANCDWTYKADEYIIDIKKGIVCKEATGNCSASFHYSTDKKIYPGEHAQSRFVVRALYLTYAWMIRDSGRTLEDATRAFKWLLYLGLRGHLAGSSNFNEVSSAFWSACDQLSSANWPGPVKLSTPDCVAVVAGFRKVDLLNRALKINEFTELCNDWNDNDDKPKDNCTQVGESCSLNESLTDDTLNKIGDYNGKACPMVCKKGEWEYYLNDPLRAFPGKTEVCNYLDDDCDGLVDEVDAKEFGLRVDYGADSDHDGYPSVSRIEKVCEGDNALVLQGLPQGSRYDDQVKDFLRINSDLSNADCDDSNPNVHPGAGATEVCSNGIDDDCDGSTDESCPCTHPADSPRPCKAPQGLDPECPDGVQFCQPSGTWSDCIAPDDTNVIGTSCVIAGNQGICLAGTRECVGKSIVCVQASQPESKDIPCNGLDDDCDGAADEDDDALLGTACSPATDSQGTVLTGICGTGIYGCRNNQLTCLPVITPNTVPETCNGLNDDCDPDGADEIDDIVKSTGRRCVSGLHGICSEGQVGCSSGVLTCTPNPSGTEVCNGLDDDCDATVDNVSGVNTDCVDGSKQGICRYGKYLCVGNALTCVTNRAMPETCNGEDDDCDGVIDNGVQCSGPSFAFAWAHVNVSSQCVFALGAAHNIARVETIPGKCYQFKLLFVQAAKSGDYVVVGNTYNVSDVIVQVVETNPAYFVIETNDPGGEGGDPSDITGFYVVVFSQ